MPAPFAGRFRSIRGTSAVKCHLNKLFRRANMHEVPQQNTIVYNAFSLVNFHLCKVFFFYVISFYCGRTAGRSSNCPASSTSVPPSTMLRRLSSLKRALAAEAPWKATSVCRRSGTQKGTPLPFSCCPRLETYSSLFSFLRYSAFLLLSLLALYHVHATGANGCFCSG